MPDLVASLVDLCRFRRGPEDLPYSPRLLVGLLVGCGILQVLFGWYHGARPGALVAALLGALAVVGVVFLVLRARGKSERFVQTMTALAGVYLLFGIVTDALALLLPLDVLYRQFIEHPGQPPTLSPAQTLVAFVVFGLGVWQWCVWIRVLRRALDVSVAGGVLVFILLVLVDLIVGSALAAAMGAA